LRDLGTRHRACETSDLIERRRRYARSRRRDSRIILASVVRRSSNWHHIARVASLEFPGSRHSGSTSGQSARPQPRHFSADPRLAHKKLGHLPRQVSGRGAVKLSCASRQQSANCRISVLICCKAAAKKTARQARTLLHRIYYPFVARICAACLSRISAFACATAAAESLATSIQRLRVYCCLRSVLWLFLSLADSPLFAALGGEIPRPARQSCQGVKILAALEL